MSRAKYYAEVEPQEETTVLFRFATDFEPGEIGMVVKLEFVDPDNNVFAVTGYQGNLKVSDPVIEWDIQTYALNYILLMMNRSIFIYVTTAAFLAGVSYLIYSVFVAKPVSFLILFMASLSRWNNAVVALIRAALPPRFVKQAMVLRFKKNGFQNSY